MSGSIRWLIGMLMLYTLLSILGNIIDMQPSFLSANQTSTLSSATGYQTVTTVGQSGASAPVWTMVPLTAAGWWQMLSWNFSFWKEYDPATGTLVDSPLIIIYWILFYPLTIGMVILIALTLRALVFGA